MRISDWSSDVCSSDLGVGQLRLRRKIVEWTKQFLGIGARRGKALLQIDRRLRVRDTVHGAVEKQRLTPVFGMTSELHRYRHRSQMEFAEDQSVEQFAGRTAVVTLGVVAVLDRKSTRLN